MSLIWLVEGLFNMERNLISVFVQRNYFRNTEFVGMRILLYFFGVSLSVGVLTECGALQYVGDWLETNVNNVYLYGLGFGLLSCVVDNVPVVLAGMNMFDLDTAAESVSPFVQDGVYWQMLSYCTAMGGALLFIGTLAGQTVLQVSKVHLSWYFKHYYWRVLIAWFAGLVAFAIVHI